MIWRIGVDMHGKRMHSGCKLLAAAIASCICFDLLLGTGTNGADDMIPGEGAVVA